MKIETVRRMIVWTGIGLFATTVTLMIAAQVTAPSPEPKEDPQCSRYWTPDGRYVLPDGCPIQNPD